MDAPILIPTRCSIPHCNHSPKFILPCTDSICPDHLTQAWHDQSPFFSHINCPLCGEHANFPIPPTIEKLYEDDREMFEDAEEIRKEPGFSNTAIAVAYSEAVYLLRRIYSAIEDQFLDSQLLGGGSDHTSSKDYNVFLKTFEKHFTDPSDSNKRILVTAGGLEQELSSILQTSIVEFAVEWYSAPLSRRQEWREALEMGDERRCFAILIDNVQEVREVEAVWREVLENFVGVLVGRHLGRFEGSRE